MVNKPRERSTAYPAIDLSTAVDLIKTLTKNAGFMGSFDRELIAKAMGYSGITGTSASRLAALAHYGLISRDGANYSISNLAKTILRPVSDRDQVNAVEQALRNPKLFESLLQEFKLDPPKMLGNILFNKYGISGKYSNKVTKIFLESLAYAKSKNCEFLDLKKEEDVTKIDDTLNNQNNTNNNSVSIEICNGITVKFSPNMFTPLLEGSFKGAIAELKHKGMEYEENNNNTND